MTRKNPIFNISIAILFLAALVCLSMENLSRADSRYNPSHYLGVPIQLMPQMYVYVEVLEETSPGVYQSYGPTTDPYGFVAYNYCLLDTGANSILIVDDAAAQLEANGYQTEGLFWEVGVGGYTEYDVSAPYRFAVTGTNSVTHNLDGSEGQGVRILSSPDTYLGAPLDSFGGIPGLVGMPAMSGRVTTMDMTHWIDTNDIFDLLEVGATFSQTLPTSPTGATRYTVALDNRISFSVEDGLPTGSPPNSPLPEYADVPFLTAGAALTGVDSIHREKYGTFLLDTGAQFSIISRRMAFALGLDEDGNGDLDEHAIDFMVIGGVGGSKTVPVMLIDELRLPTEQGIDLVWADTSGDPESLGIQVLVMDLFECGDIDFSGTVDALDIATITDNLGSQVAAGDIPSGDINGDGWVTNDDLTIAQSQLGESAFIDGICGIDMWNSGVDLDPYTLEPIGNPYFDQVHFDFRDWENGEGTLVLDVDGDYSTIVTPEVPGDANGDGVVDASDATILAGHWQQSVTNGAASGDFNDDGIVDASDATILAGNWGVGTSTADATVPEPSTWALLASLGLLALFRWRHKK